MYVWTEIQTLIIEKWKAWDLNFKQFIEWAKEIAYQTILKMRLSSDGNVAFEFVLQQ